MKCLVPDVTGRSIHCTTVHFLQSYPIMSRTGVNKVKPEKAKHRYDETVLVAVTGLSPVLNGRIADRHW